MNRFIFWIGRKAINALVTAVFFILAVLGIVYATISWPSTVPENEVEGGKFQVNFNRIFDIMTFIDGKVGIGTGTPNIGLKLDVEGKIWATEYCDKDGNNCKTVANMGGTLSGYEVRTSSMSSNGHFSVSVACSSGKIIIGGGCHQDNAYPYSHRAIVSSSPNNSHNGWYCRTRDIITSQSATVTVYAICFTP